SIVLELDLKTAEQTDEISFVPEIMRRDETRSKISAVCSAVCRVTDGRLPTLSQTQILDKFIRGLKPKTRIEVELRDPKTPEEAYRLADRFDRIVYSAKSTTFLTQHYNRYS